MKIANIARQCALTLLLVAACSSSSSPEGGDPRECDPRAPKSGADYTTDALPSGSCDQGVPTCTLAARVPCACTGTGGPVNVYECSCTNSSWNCSIKYVGTSLCLCPDAAAVDAGADG